MPLTPALAAPPVLARVWAHQAWVAASSCGLTHCRRRRSPTTRRGSTRAVAQRCPGPTPRLKAHSPTRSPSLHWRHPQVCTWCCRRVLCACVFVSSHHAHDAWLGAYLVAVVAVVVVVALAHSGAQFHRAARGQPAALQFDASAPAPASISTGAPFPTMSVRVVDGYGRPSPPPPGSRITVGVLARHRCPCWARG